MKKLLGYVSLTLIVLLTACADNLDEIAEAGKGDVLSDRVPVELSISPSSNTTDMTRSPLATTTNGNFETPRGASPSDYVYMGVFALAQTNTPAGGNTSAVATGDIQWEESYARALWNQPTMATIVGESTTLQFVDPSTLNTTPKVVSRYYPLNSWYNYYFYSYYPRVDDSNVHVSNNNVVTADYTLNGSQDIITGVAKPATDVNNGYCGKYFRNNSQASLPQLTQEHHLAQLRFFVRSKMPAVGTFQMKEITMLDVPTEWALTIADKSNDNNRGTLISRSATKANIPVREITVDASNNMTSASDDPVYDGTAYTALTTTPRIAGYAMVPTTAMIETANSTLNRNFSTDYIVQLTIRSNNEVSELTRTISTPNGGFLPGKVYNVIINVDQSSIEDLEIDPREVDMGFPSKTKWACMNIGASTETDLGETDIQLFAWGAIEGHKAATTQQVNDGYHFTMENAPYYQGKMGNDYYWTKYSSGGSVLEAEDDYAALSWGGKWRLPTAAEVQELVANTTHTWETKNGVNGMTFTSKINGNSIFMPAIGYRSYTGSGPRDTMYERNSSGYYWSSSLSQSDNSNAFCLKFTSSGASRTNMPRGTGLLIRAVKK